MNPSKLISYNRWANERTLASIPGDTDSSDRRLQLFGHIVGGLRLWLLRMQHVPFDSPRYQAMKERVFPQSITWEQCKSELDSINSSYEEFITAFDLRKLEEIVHYHNLAGVPQQASMDEMIYHIVNHSTYHRAQIASLVRAAGVTPAMTDYYIFATEQRKKS